MAVWLARVCWGITPNGHATANRKEIVMDNRDEEKTADDRTPNKQEAERDDPKQEDQKPAIIDLASI